MNPIQVPNDGGLIEGERELRTFKPRARGRLCAREGLGEKDLPYFAYART
jgi:hypothetical protein